MRINRIPILCAALLLLGPAAAVGQAAVCTLPDTGSINNQDWSALQRHLGNLYLGGAFDTHPLVSDRQSLVQHGNAGKRARSMALVAASPFAGEVPDTTLASGCFVGMIESQRAEPGVGAFRGKTFVWIDRQGPNGSWRSIHFPLDGASWLDEGTRISLPYLVPDPDEPGARFVPPDAHYVYEGQLYVADLVGYPFWGARWMIRPGLEPSAGSPDFPSMQELGMLPPGLMLYQILDPTPTWAVAASDVEVMGCYRCDSSICCPTNLLLSVFGPE